MHLLKIDEVIAIGQVGEPELRAFIAEYVKRICPPVSHAWAMSPEP